MTRWFLIIIFSLPLFAQSPDYYIEKINNQVAGVEDMAVTIHIKSRMPGLTVPDRTGKLFFKRPDKVHFEGNGFMMIPKEALMLDLTPFLDDSTTTIQIFRPDSLKGRPLIVAGINRIIDNRIIKSFAFIDTNRWVIQTLKMDEGKNFQASLEFDYKYVDNSVYLPKKVIMKVESEKSMNRRVKNPRSRRKEKIDNKPGMITLTFSKHNINIGLKDELFTEEE